MTKPTFIDTFFVLAFVNTEDAFHARAIELSARFKGAPLLTTDGVLLEVGNALARGRRREAGSLIRDLMADELVEVVEIDSVTFERALHLYENRPDKQWGLVDCASFVVMQRRGVVDALTYDQHFVQAGFNALMRD